MIATLDTHGLDRILPVMRRAFDPRFGEAWSAEQCRGVLAMPGARLLVAHADGIVGFALSRTVLDESELMLLAVDPESRRRGIGSRLLLESMKLAREAGACRYVLEVRSDNPARNLYRHHGFDCVGRRPQYYRGKDGIVRDALTMAAALR